MELQVSEAFNVRPASLEQREQKGTQTFFPPGIYNTAGDLGNILDPAPAVSLLPSPGMAHLFLVGPIMIPLAFLGSLWGYGLVAQSRRRLPPAPLEPPSKPVDEQSYILFYGNG